MAELIINRIQEHLFEHILDGVQLAIDNAPNLTTIQNLETGDIVLHFKTKNGAPLVKNQEIRPQDITITDTFGGEPDQSGYTNASQIWEYLNFLGYFVAYGNSGGGGTGTDYFKFLEDVFPQNSYAGQNGKVYVVNEAMNRLEGTYLYNFQYLTQHKDVESISAENVPNGYVLTAVTVTDINGVNQKIFGFRPQAQVSQEFNFVLSNEDLSLAKRNGDFVYGILDQYTGEEMTLSKVSGTPEVDGIIYFQIGDEYFKRNYSIFNRKWLGDGEPNFLSYDGNILATNIVYDGLFTIENGGSDTRVWKQTQNNGIDGSYRYQVSQTNSSLSPMLDVIEMTKDRNVRFFKQLLLTEDGETEDSAVRLSQLAGLSKKGKNVVVVAKENGDFSTIDGGLQYAILNSSEESPHIVYVMPGEYEEFLQIPPDKFITIMGYNKNSCILIDKSGDYFQAPISMAGNVTIANMTIIASNENVSVPPPAIPSYAIHHDSGGEGKSYILNCRLISYQSASIGIGTQNNQQITIQDTEMIGIGANAGALLMHPYPLSGATNQKLIVRNCYMQSDNDAPIALIDSNNNGGGAGDNTDTTLEFTNNTVFSTTNGVTNLVYGTPPISGGDYGKMKLTVTSTFNNIKQLNYGFFEYADNNNLVHTSGDENIGGVKSFTDRTIFKGGASINNFLGGSWLDMPTSGPSAIGSGGVGSNVWLAYVKESTQFFANSLAGDIISKNSTGRLLFGTVSDVPAQLILDNTGLKASQPVTVPNATASNHATALNQVVSNTNTASATLNLTTPSRTNYYQHTGTGATWTLPDATTNVMNRIVCTHKGSGNLKINAFSANQIWESGTPSSDYSASVGESVNLYSDGVHWIVL